MNSSDAAVPYSESVTRAGPEAPWMTLVHGVSQDRRLFAAQVEDFARDFRLLLIDLPGHGLSSSLPGPYGLEEFAAAIRAALRTAGVSRSHFWGTHLGASAGLLLACRETGLFTSLILEGPVFPGRPLPAVAEMLGRVATTAKTQGIEAARRQWWEDAGWFAVMRARPEACRAAEQRAMIDDFRGGPWLDAGLVRPIDPIDDLLDHIRTPVLLMNGEHDMGDFLQVTEALAGLLPNCRRALVKEGGGFPLWEFPDRVNAEVRRFLGAV